MKDAAPVARALRAAIVLAACGSALAVIAGLSAVVLFLAARTQHGTLDAASVAIREALGDARGAQTFVLLDRFHEAFAVWGITAAAFDRGGSLVWGDGRLRGDGLATGRTPAPPVGRQLALVNTHDGYVVVAMDPDLIARQRATLILADVLLLTACALAGSLIGGRWARMRARASAQISAQLALDSRSAVVVSDPLFGTLSREVAAAIERLSRSLSDRSDGETRLRTFLAEAAHELRTPLAIAIGYVGILERGGLADADLAARIIADISSEQARLRRLVESILQLARLDAIDGDRNAICDAVQIADEAVALVRPLAISRTISLTAQGPAWTAVAPDDLRDALRNILENAVLHAPDAPISIEIVAHNEGIVVRVRDAGPGMDAFTVAHAFDRFFRGPNRGDVSGTGLGLSIVRRVAERAAGTVRIESAPGAGTCVELQIPPADVTQRAH